MEVVFDNPAIYGNLTIVGTLFNNNTAIEGKCFDARSPTEGWDIELYKGVAND
jgi:hypothetical protein